MKSTAKWSLGRNVRIIGRNIRVITGHIILWLAFVVLPDEEWDILFDAIREEIHKKNERSD